MKLEDKLLSLIRANTEDNACITLESDLRRQLQLDSFGMLMVINAIEESFRISIHEEDFAKANTVADVAALLRTKYNCI